MFGQAASKQFSGQAAELRCAAAPWADFVCVLCFCQLHMCPVRGSGHFRCSLCFMYILCVRVGGKAALAAAIRSAVTKIFCPKTLSSVNIYGAIAVHPLPSPSHHPPPPLSVLFYPVLTHGNENFQQNLCQGRRGMPQQSTATTNQTNGK